MTPEVQSTIQAISYSPVASKRDEVWDQCVVGDELDAKVRDRFLNYVERCAQGIEDGYTEVTFANADGEFLKERLRELLKLPIDKKNKRCREITLELADRLSKKMSESGSAPKSGAIFVVQTVVEKKPSVAIVKLDLGRKEIIALQNTRDNHEIFSRIFERALPEDAKYFRKSVYYPSQTGGDARSIQVDAFSDYWEKFVGAKPVRQAKKATGVVIETARETKR